MFDGRTKMKPSSARDASKRRLRLAGEEVASEQLIDQVASVLEAPRRSLGLDAGSGAWHAPGW